MNEELLLKDSEEFVTRLFETKVDPAFSFHNISHTKMVVKAAEEIAGHYRLEGTDRTALLVAAWFHDTGYSKGHAEGHEQESQQIVTSFLKEKQIDEIIINKVNGCIRATQMPQSPSSLIEQIICDADLFHLGTDDFEKESKLLRQELNAVYKKDISKKEWRKNNIEFLRQHNYFTDYAHNKLDPLKQVHIIEMGGEPVIQKEKPEPVNEKERQKQEKRSATEKLEAEIKLLRDRLTKEKESRSERGATTMFRIMSDNHVSLSQMADSKANIMISVNTIVLSILVSVLLGKLQYYPHFIIPTIILSVVCLAAIIFAILATRPNITRGTFTKEDIEQKKVNLLFFGNFHRMSLPDYDWAMNELIADKEYLYGSMIKDTYFLGVVLAKKYRFLRTSYNIFMYGLIVAFIAFAVSAFIGA